MNRMLRLAGAYALVAVIGGLTTGCGSDTSAGVFIPATPVAEEIRQEAAPAPTPTPIPDAARG